MARSIPKVREGSLLQQSAEDTTTSTISIGTTAWYSWLEQHHAFTFKTPRSIANLEGLFINVNSFANSSSHTRVIY